MKKTTYLFLVLIILTTVSIPSSSFAEGKVPPAIKINDKLFVTPAGEPQPYINKDYRTMGSVRLVGNALGVLDDNIEWDDQARTVTMQKNDILILITVGQPQLSVNGKTMTMDTVAELKNGRVFIPLRFIAESLNAEIDFDEETRTILITTDDPSVGKHNFSTFKDLVVLENFPIVLEANGLKLTVHEAYLYKADSKEAQDLEKKYKFQEYYRAKYLLWSKVTLENNSKQTIRFDGSDMNPKIEWFTASKKKGVRLLPTSSINVDKWNNPEILNGWVLKPGESITSHEAQIDYETETLIDTIAVAVTNKSVSTTKLLAVGKDLL